MNGKITIVGNLVRYGNDVLNLADMDEADLKFGRLLMRSGKVYEIPTKVLECWFSNIMDWKELEKSIPEVKA